MWVYSLEGVCTSWVLLGVDSVLVCVLIPFSQDMWALHLAAAFNVDYRAAVFALSHSTFEHFANTLNVQPGFNQNGKLELGKNDVFKF